VTQVLAENRIIGDNTVSGMTDGSGVGAVDGAAIARIKAQDRGGDKSTLGIATLMWISYAEPPPRVAELCHALAVKLGLRGFQY